MGLLKVAVALVLFHAAVTMGYVVVGSASIFYNDQMVSAVHFVPNSGNGVLLWGNPYRVRAGPVLPGNVTTTATHVYGNESCDVGCVANSQITNLTDIDNAHGMAVRADGVMYGVDSNNNRILNLLFNSQTLESTYPDTYMGDFTAQCLGRANNTNSFNNSSPLGDNVRLLHPLSVRFRGSTGQLFIGDSFAIVVVSGPTMRYYLGSPADHANAHLPPTNGEFRTSARTGEFILQMDLFEDSLMFFTDYSLHIVRKVDLGTGIVTQAAGTGVNIDNGCINSCPVATTPLKTPYGVAVAPWLRVAFISETKGYVIRALAWELGTVNVVLGFPNMPGPTDHCVLNKLHGPRQLAISSENLFIADETAVIKANLVACNWNPTQAPPTGNYDCLAIRDECDDCAPVQASCTLHNDPTLCLLAQSCLALTAQCHAMADLCESCA